MKKEHYKLTSHQKTKKINQAELIYHPKKNHASYKLKLIKSCRTCNNRTMLGRPGAKLTRRPSNGLNQPRKLHTTLATRLLTQLSPPKNLLNTDNNKPLVLSNKLESQ